MRKSSAAEDVISNGLHAKARVNLYFIKTSIFSSNSRGRPPICQPWCLFWPLVGNALSHIKGPAVKKQSACLRISDDKSSKNPLNQGWCSDCCSHLVQVNLPNEISAEISQTSTLFLIEHIWLAPSSFTEAVFMLLSVTHGVKFNGSYCIKIHWLNFQEQLAILAPSFARAIPSQVTAADGN